jgi:hypothetical protein
MSTDAVTALLSRAIDFLFVDDRRATSMGILFGGLVLFLSKLFAPALRQQSVVDFAQVPSYLFIIVGIFLFNAPRFLRGDVLPRTAEARLKLVRTELRAKRISREEAHAMYKTVLEEELANLLAERQMNPPTPSGPRTAARA